MKRHPFPQCLRATRESRNLTQDDLAEKSGLQASAVSHFECGRRSPSLANFIALCDALRVSADSLLGRIAP